ncbi:hypothetical protein [Bizionia myxarmorum]|uniref:Uncharacterized protein n=1 Tax=Bizionia myxarmorum TaxID=291186 RepID=A0A5D0RCD8_9FLAO|nr:hypothetical protein [Bizionia myxarmorum]TYB78541.1 hypothetical protein ES674_01825 [Bizionia myxarmorum]
MQKITMFIFILLISISMFSQKANMLFKNEDASRKASKEAFTLSNTVTNDLTFLMVERKDVYAYLFNSAFELQSQFKTEVVKSKYDEALGFKLSGEKQHILFSNTKKTKFAVLTLDFSAKNSQATELDFDFGDELFIEAVNYKNKLYVLSSTKDQEIIIRELTDGLDFIMVTRMKINQEDVNLRERKNFSTFSLFGSLKTNIQKIDPRVPNALEQTSTTNKLYQYDNLVYLTFEVEDSGTLVYTINFEDLTHSIKTYDYPKGKLDDLKRYNSYISPEYFYQIASSKDEMRFLINDLSGALIKEFYIKKDASISFKNTPIIQEGATALPFVNRREMEESSKYLRKITSGDLGIAVLFQDNQFYMTLGGYKEVASGGGMMMGAPGGVGTVGPSHAVVMNPTFYSYNSYTSSKSTYFVSKFDKDFNHIKGKISENVFEKIKKYSSKLKYITAENVFFHNDQLYFGSFDLKKATYNLVPF